MPKDLGAQSRWRAAKRGGAPCPTGCESGGPEDPGRVPQRAEIERAQRDLDGAIGGAVVHEVEIHEVLPVDIDLRERETGRHSFPPADDARTVARDTEAPGEVAG